MRRLPAAGLVTSALVLTALVPMGAASARPTIPDTAGPSASAATPASAVPGDGGIEDPYYPGKSNPEIDTLHDNLALRWDGTILTGTAKIRFATTRDTDRVRLDLIRSLHVRSVRLDGAAIDYARRGIGLVMSTGSLTEGESHTLRIHYSGLPHTVKAPTHRGDFGEGLGWTLDSDGNVYTFQEPYGAYSWYPVNDHPSDKATYDAQITVPTGDTAVFNGTLVGEQRAAKSTTFRWHLSSPVASYLTTIAIGPYTAYSDTMSDGTTATYWLLPRDASIINSLKSQSADAFDWLEDHAGPYPFDTFSTVVTGGDSAMETQTIVTLSRQAFDRPDAVIEHEMAHQWFGDAITPRDWQGLWLSEGWAMWMQQAYEVYRGGYKYLGGMDNWRSYDESSRQASGPPGDYDPKSFGDLNVYLGPAMMLDKIRQRVGDEKFTALSEAWVADHAYGNATRQEFVRWLNAETGERFNQLVNLWLDSPHTPEWP
jgi:aminopeptidase N